MFNCQTESSHAVLVFLLCLLGSHLLGLFHGPLPPDAFVLSAESAPHRKSLVHHLLLGGRGFEDEVVFHPHLLLLHLLGLGETPLLKPYQRGGDKGRLLLPETFRLELASLFASVLPAAVLHSLGFREEFHLRL